VIRRSAAVLLAAALWAAPGPASGDQRLVRPLVGATVNDAARISAETAGPTSTVLLARGDDPADALAATFLAKPLHAVILLSGRDALPSETDAGLRTLNASRVVVMGGPAAIGPRVVTALLSRGLTVERIGGATRYETAALAARTAGGGVIGSVGGVRTALLASGTSFADAVAGGPVAFARTLPVLLTERGRLPEATRLVIADLVIDQVVVLGGPDAVGDEVVGALGEAGLMVERLAGPDRAATSVEVAEWAIARLGFSTHRLGLVRGDDLAAGLAYGVLAGRSRGAAGLPVSAPPEVAPNALLLSRTTDDIGTEAYALAARMGPAVTEAELPGSAPLDPTAVHDGFLAALGERAPAALPTFSPAQAVSRKSSVPADGGPEGLQGVVEVTVSGLTAGRYDLALVPCASIDDSSGTPVFRDADVSGFADGSRRPGPGVSSADTAASEAFIRSVNGQRVTSAADDVVDDIDVPAGTIVFELDHLTTGPTCVRPVLVDDEPTTGVPLHPLTGTSAAPTVVGPPVSWRGPPPTIPT
jgi:putative cell wall-binding protein